jgi:hypothetical protein
MTLLATLACDLDPAAVQQSSNPPPPPFPQARLDEMLATSPLDCPEGTQVEWTGGRGIIAACTRDDGTRHGPFLSWDLDGTRAAKGMRLDGVIHGQTERWLPDGSTRPSSSYYFHGKGARRLEDALGACAPGSELLDGEYIGHGVGSTQPGCYALHPEKGVVRHGPAITFCGKNDQGLPRVRGVMYYRWGVRHGPSYWWWSEDQLASESHDVEGKSYGASRSWFRDGTLASERHFVLGKQDGFQRHYEPDGALRWEAEFRYGRWISTEGDMSILDRVCPEGSAPVGHAPPHGLQIQCIDLSGEHDQKSLPAVTWVDGEPVLDDPPFFWPSWKVGERCGPSRLTP